MKARFLHFRVLLLGLIPLIVLFPRGGVWQSEEAVTAEILTTGAFSQSVEAYTRSNFPLADRLRGLAVNLRYLGGSREQNGVFINGDRLLKSVSVPDPGVVERNNEAVLEFARYLRSSDIPFFFALIPTASGIMSQSLPAYAQTLDQRRLIEDVYSQMTGKLTTIDTYLQLSSNREEYLYYRTEDNLTAYGGYHVYAAMAKRLRAVDTPSYSAYDITYAGNSFRGDLYETAPFDTITPDVLVVFRYTKHLREYMVTHVDEEGSRLYHTLYPEHLQLLGRDTDIYLGGSAVVVDIRTSAPYDRSLLIFGDKTAQAYLPFLVNHYRQVTLVDLSRDPVLYSGILAEDYDQVLMAYSVETYTANAGAPTKAPLFIDE